MQRYIIDNDDNAAMKAVRKDIVVLQDAVDELNTAEVDLSSVTPKADFNTLTSRVATLENTPPNLTLRLKTSYVTAFIVILHQWSMRSQNLFWKASYR